jgi:PBP1b-binding outer membrane lipoprotein LpoB
MKKAVQVVGAALCAALLLAGCSNVTLPTVAGDSASSQTSSEKKTVVSQSPSSAADSKAAASSQAEVSSENANDRGSGDEGPVNTISTDSEAFNKKFKNNPIDERYASEMSTLITTTDIVELTGKFTSLWNKEITHAMEELKAKLETTDAEKWSKIQADQKKWEDGKAAAIEEIGKSVQTGGSVARVTTATKVMEYYRARAAALYRILYDYEPDFTYAYTK